MKNLSQILNVVLVIAVAFLFFKVFADGGSKNSDNSENTAFTSETSDQAGPRIAYINMDTLKSTFEYYGELNAQMEKDMESAQQLLESRQQGFQESYALFQQMAPGMSEEELARNQQDLMGLQQQLVGLQQELEQELMEKEGELLMKLKTDIDSVLVITKDELGLDFVFTYQPGSPLLYANETFDITVGVVEKLNTWHPDSRMEE